MAGLAALTRDAGVGARFAAQLAQRLQAAVEARDSLAAGNLAAVATQLYLVGLLPAGTLYGLLAHLRARHGVQGLHLGLGFRSRLLCGRGRAAVPGAPAADGTLHGCWRICAPLQGFKRGQGSGFHHCCTAVEMATRSPAGTPACMVQPDNGAAPTCYRRGERRVWLAVAVSVDHDRVLPW